MAQEENYFFVIEDNDKNRLPSLQGTWKLYCSEFGLATAQSDTIVTEISELEGGLPSGDVGKPGVPGPGIPVVVNPKPVPPSISESVLVDQGQFTSDGNGGFEYNNGEPIIVDNTGGQPFQSFIIVIETIGYKKGISFGSTKSTGDKNDPTRIVPTDQNYQIKLLTESQYIEERISNIKNTLENRIMAA